MLIGLRSPFLTQSYPLTQGFQVYIMMLFAFQSYLFDSISSVYIIFFSSTSVSLMACRSKWGAIFGFFSRRLYFHWESASWQSYRLLQTPKIKSLISEGNTVLCVGIQSSVEGLYSHIRSEIDGNDFDFISVSSALSQGDRQGFLFFTWCRGPTESIPSLFFYKLCLKDGWEMASRWGRRWPDVCWWWRLYKAITRLSRDCISVDVQPGSIKEQRWSYESENNFNWLKTFTAKNELIMVPWNPSLIFWIVNPFLYPSIYIIIHSTFWIHTMLIQLKSCNSFNLYFLKRQKYQYWYSSSHVYSLFNQGWQQIKPSYVAW